MATNRKKNVSKQSTEKVVNKPIEEEVKAEEAITEESNVVTVEETVEKSSNVETEESDEESVTATEIENVEETEPIAKEKSKKANRVIIKDFESYWNGMSVEM